MYRFIAKPQCFHSPKSIPFQLSHTHKLKKFSGFHLFSMASKPKKLAANNSGLTATPDTATKGYFMQQTMKLEEVKVVPLTFDRDTTATGETTVIGDTAVSYSKPRIEKPGRTKKGEGGRRATREGLGSRQLKGGSRGGADSTDGGDTAAEPLQGEPRV
ncbi:hypothetical protein Ahy_A10g050206 [Arachis hypogaea]|uniref:Uncharacterized protein n=1 Tax=Arachis hypogaea TaxID=3818 RepID=A0A445B8T0_ARAHY|nr:hypothetical protein Ahy_A10g050206 [Arachis hypogaea]